MMAQKASPLLKLVVIFRMLTLLYPSVTLLHQACRAFVPHRAMVSSYQPLCDVISEIYKYVVQRMYISMTRCGYGSQYSWTVLRASSSRISITALVPSWNT